MNGIMLTIDGNQDYCEQHNMIYKDGDTQVVPFIINLSSDRLQGMFALIGLDYSEYGGQCWGYNLLNAMLASTGKPLRVDVEEYGMTLSDAAFYIVRMQSMAEEAISREERIIWS